MGEVADSKDVKHKDFGGFKVTSSRIPDCPKPDLASVAATKVVVNGLVSRQR